jgi:hypothetical protein
MHGDFSSTSSTARGILIQTNLTNVLSEQIHELAGSILLQLGTPDLADHVDVRTGMNGRGEFLQLHLNESKTLAWAPGLDTLALAQTLHLSPHTSPDDLNREIVVAMLMGPIAFEFPSINELLSSVRIRQNIVQATRKTALAFDTQHAERPQDCWTYHEGLGFTLLPGVPLIKALTKATQPANSGTLYSFSCYRATEYLILLGIAQELEQSNPALLEELQQLWSQRAVMSGEFHDVFLHEQGSMDNPLPAHYYVPGDRTWFRNPHEASADASGFEGSWVMYMGNGEFTNFWKPDSPYTLTYKCLEIFHWRHGLYRDESGEARIDEAKVDLLVHESLKNPSEVTRIVALMSRYREPRGVYTDAGGCIDTTREFARWVQPGTSDLVLPKK